MNIILTTLKNIFIALIIILTGLVGFCYYLHFNPIKTSSNFLQQLINLSAPQFTAKGEDGVLTFSDYKLFLSYSKTTLTNNNNVPINLDNIKIAFNVLSYCGQLTASIVNSPLLALISIQNNPKEQQMIDDFNSQNHIPFNGEVSVNFGLLRSKEVQVKLSSAAGWHKSQQANLVKINLVEFFIDLHYMHNQLSIKKFQIKYNNNITASLQGNFIFTQKDLSLAEFQADITNLPVEYLVGLWPKILFPEVHDWVSSHVKKGIIKKAHGILKLTAEDLKENTIIPKESIKAEIEFANATIDYLETYTPITNAEGIISFDGEALYVKTNKAELLNNKITDILLTLPYNKPILSLKANTSGSIGDFKEFIPNKFFQKLNGYGLSFNDIQGKVNGSFNLTIPTSDNFQISDLQFEVKANFKDLSIKHLSFLEFNTGTITLKNEADKLKLTMQHKDKLSLAVTNHHKEEDKHLNQINIYGDVEIKQEINTSNFKLTPGYINIDAALTAETWKTKFNFLNTEIFFTSLGYTKAKNSSFILECAGDFLENTIESKDCSISGKEISGKVGLVYSYKDKILSKLSLENIRMGENNFKFESSSKPGFYTYNLVAKTLNLSQATFINPNNNDLNNYTIFLKADKIKLKNDTDLYKVNANIKKIGTAPNDISFSAFSDSDQITINKTTKNDKEVYILHSTSAGLFSQAFGIYKNIKKGDLLIDIYPTRNSEGMEYNENLLVKNFYLTNTSILSKIILGILSPLNSPQALAQALQGGSLKADSFTADLNYKKGILKLKNGSINGTSYEIKLHGLVDANNNQLEFKGLYIPSFYGINKIISMIPLLGKLLSGGDDSAFLAASFGVKGSFDKPNTSFNPLSILTPGFIRNLFN